jgi:hypothetical protein
MDNMHGLVSDLDENLYGICAGESITETGVSLSTVCPSQYD